MAPQEKPDAVERLFEALGKVREALTGVTAEQEQRPPTPYVQHALDSVRMRVDQLEGAYIKLKSRLEEVGRRERDDDEEGEDGR